MLKYKETIFTSTEVFMNICVYCASSETIDKKYLEAGERFGEQLAEKNCTLVFGAGKYGVMGAVARGVRRMNGKAIGVIPAFFKDRDVTFADCEIIQTETMRERKQIMEDKSDAFVILPGGIGTFEEFFEILTLKQLSRHSKPIVFYNVDGYYDSLFDFLEHSVAEGFMDKKVFSLFCVASTRGEIFSYLQNYVPDSYDKYNFLEK